MNDKDYPRVKTSTILQMDNAECGSAALGIILAFYGRYESASELRSLCDVTRDGSKAINIIKAARQYGLEAHVMQLNMENIKLLPPPFIAYWQFNHFLVVEGFEKNKVHINDPATGPRTISVEEFSKNFTGIVLYLVPGPDFKPQGKPEKPLHYLLWRHLKGAFPHVIYTILVTLTLFFPQLSLAFFSKIFIDNIVIESQQQWIFPFLISMFIALGMMIILHLLKNKFLLSLRLKLKINTLIPFFRHLLDLPIHFFQQRATGDIAERIEAYHRMANLLVDQILNNILNIFLIFYCWVALCFLNFTLALLIILVSLINFMIVWWIANRKVDQGSHYAQAEGKLAGIELNALRVIETIQVNALDNQFFNQWAAAYAQKINNWLSFETQKYFLNFFPFVMQSLSLILLISYGGWLVFNGELTLGSFLAVIILSFNFNYPISEMVNLRANLFKTRGDIARINDVINYGAENVLKSNADQIEVSAKKIVSALEFKNIQFGYSRLEPPIFENLNFSIKTGERVAVVGPTGGGKSSLIKLICGLYAPWTGEVSILGSSLSNISRSILARWVGVVEQQIFLFSASIRENLTLWNASISDSMIYHALHLVGMSEVVTERGGLEAWVEERGKNFSGGQVQRFEIARALLSNPLILVLDEATSALDPVSEQEIYNNLKNQQITLLIIAHRLSAIRDCDQILVIDNGRIVESGNHESLIKESGLYQELVDLEIQ